MGRKNSSCVTNREIAIMVGELHKLRLAVDKGQPKPKECEWRTAFASLVGRVLTWSQVERIMHDCGFMKGDLFQSTESTDRKKRTAEFELMLESVAKSVQTHQEDAKEIQRKLESFSCRLMETETLYNRLAMHVNALLARVREIGAKLDVKEAGSNE